MENKKKALTWRNQSLEDDTLLQYQRRQDFFLYGL